MVPSQDLHSFRGLVAQQGGWDRSHSFCLLQRAIKLSPPSLGLVLAAQPGWASSAPGAVWQDQGRRAAWQGWGRGDTLSGRLRRGVALQVYPSAAFQAVCLIFFTAEEQHVLILRRLDALAVYLPQRLNLRLRKPPGPSWAPRQLVPGWPQPGHVRSSAERAGRQR